MLKAGFNCGSAAEQRLLIDRNSRFGNFALMGTSNLNGALHKLSAGGPAVATTSSAVFIASYSIDRNQVGGND